MIWLVRGEELVRLGFRRVLKFQACFAFWDTEEVLGWVPEAESDSLFDTSEDLSFDSGRVVSENVSSILLH